MKSANSLTLLILSLFILFSCQKETSIEVDPGGGPGPGPGPGGSTYGWSFKSGSDTYRGCIDSAYYETVQGIKMLSIEASDSAGNSFLIILSSPSGNITAGTYNVTTGAAIAVQDKNGNAYVSSTAASFSLQITQIKDTLVEGTFSANLSNPLTGGSFLMNNGAFKALIGKTNPCGTTGGGGGGGGGTGGNAVFTLEDLAGSCAGDVLGKYYKAKALDSTHKVTLEVSVSTPGTWVLSTNTINGIKFSGSGSFPNAGFHQITLKGSGTPTNNVTTSYPLSSGTSNCSFEVTVDTIAIAPCSPDTNTAQLSGVGTLSFTNVSGQVNGGNYQITANASGGDARLEFAGNLPPIPGVYKMKNVPVSLASDEVHVNFVAQSIFWAAPDGLVYVTVKNGKVTAVLCNIRFSGTLGGPSFNTNVSANITEK